MADTSWGTGLSNRFPASVLEADFLSGSSDFGGSIAGEARPCLQRGARPPGAQRLASPPRCPDIPRGNWPAASALGLGLGQSATAIQVSSSIQGRAQSAGEAFAFRGRMQALQILEARLGNEPLARG